MARFSIVAILALGVVPAVSAQTQASPAFTGAIDFGVRGTSLSGDGARYERYRDLGDGLALEGIRLSRERQGWLFDFMADHAGRKDQRYRGDIVKPGRLKAWLMWDQIPMLMSRTTQTLFSETSAGVLEIDNAIQNQVQQAGGSTAQAAALAALFPQNAVVFDTKSRRHILETGFEYLATPELTVKGQVRRTDREGNLPFGGSFGHSTLVEMPAPIQHTMTDVDAGAEFSRDPLLLRAGYTGSWFHNDVTSVTFDNPYRGIDAASASSRGRLTLAPSSSFIGVNGTGSVRLPYRSRATAYVSVGTLKDAGDPIVPPTVNSQLSPAPIDRPTVDGEARTTAVNLTFVSRPARRVDLNVRFRDYNYDNRTPTFTMVQRVAYDNSTGAATYSSLGGQPSGLGQVVTEPFGVGRSTFDVDAKGSIGSGLSAGIGYSRIAEERTHRVIEHSTDNVLRLTFDAVGHAIYTVRTKYEHGRKRGDVADDFEHELFTIGEQPGIRHFDVASRDRDRVTIIGTVSPTATFSLNGSFAAGKDDYVESLFGLRDNTHRVFGVGVDAVPRELVTVSGAYTYERYAAVSRSRQADPPSASSSDPFNRATFDFAAYLQFPQDSNTVPLPARASRNWASDGRDRAHSFQATADFTRVAEKVDVRVSYDFSRATALYSFITGPVPDRTLPEEAVIETTLPPPAALPEVRSELQRGTLDVMYALTPRISIGLSYWHERYRVQDFTLDFQARPDMSRAQVVLLGYLYEPYTANTVWGRLIYRW